MLSGGFEISSEMTIIQWSPYEHCSWARGKGEAEVPRALHITATDTCKIYGCNFKLNLFHRNVDMCQPGGKGQLQELFMAEESHMYLATSPSFSLDVLFEYIQDGQWAVYISSHVGMPPGSDSAMLICLGKFRKLAYVVITLSTHLAIQCICRHLYDILRTHVCFHSERIYHKQSKNLHLCCSWNYTTLYLTVRVVECHQTFILDVRVHWAWPGS